MYKNTCRHCHAEIECNNIKEFANHVRWCNPELNYHKDKFTIKCSCCVCKQEITVQNLKLHLLKHDNDMIVKLNCEWCSEPIYTKHKRFCNHSCSANYNNSVVDRSKFKPGPKKDSKLRFGPCIPSAILRRRNLTDNPTTSLKEYTYIEVPCKVCGNTFTKRQGAARMCCSKDCRMSIISLNRGRHKRSWLESSFSDWLDEHKVDYQTEVKFINTEAGTWYFVDFLFEQHKLIIELDGSQHKNTLEKDRLRDEYLCSIGYSVVRITHKQYKSKSRLAEIKSLLDI